MLIGLNNHTLSPPLAQAHAINFRSNGAQNEVVPVEMPGVISDVLTIL